MVGKKSSLKVLSRILRQLRLLSEESAQRNVISVVETTQFLQGNTARWGLAWQVHRKPDHAIVQSPDETAIAVDAPVLTTELGHAESSIDKSESVDDVL